MDQISMDSIARSFEKVASELQAFRMKYESECSLKNIKESFNSGTSLKDELDLQEPKVQKNIDDWRDYLHKYSLILISVLGFFIALATLTEKEIDLPNITMGLVLVGISLVITFIAIFSTIFLQRRIIDGNFAFGLHCKEPYTKHPDEIHYNDAIRRNLRETIQGYKVQLKSKELSKKERRVLKKTLKADMRMFRALKYSGGTYLWLEHIRVIYTVLILGTSLWGLFKIAQGFLF